MSIVNFLLRLGGDGARVDVRKQTPRDVQHETGLPRAEIAMPWYTRAIAWIAGGDHEAVELSRVDSAPSPVHILHHGESLCRLPGVPADWPAGHRWVCRDHAHDATCPDCLTVHNGGD